MTYSLKFVIIEIMEYKNFGKFVRNKRLSLQPKVAQGRFALENSIEPTVMCRTELMQQDTKISTLVRIAKGFNMRASELLKEFEESEFFE